MRENSKNTSHNSTKYSLLNKLPTETLKNMIRSDCFGSEDETLDDTTIEMILDIITLREQGGDYEVDVNVLWKNFQEEYASSIIHPTSTESKQSNDNILLHKRPLRTLRYILIATLLCLLFGNCIVFGTEGNLFDSIAKWTDEMFHFEVPSKPFSDNIDTIPNAIEIELGDE